MVTDRLNRDAVFSSVRASATAFAGMLVIAGIASPLLAQEYGGTVSVHGSLALGGYWSDESFNGNGVSFGGAVDVFPTSLVGFEVEVDGGHHSRDFTSGVGIDGSTVHFSGNVIIRFARARVQPYLVGGAGLLHSSTTFAGPAGEPSESSDEALMGNLGVGLFLFLSPRVSVRPEFRLVGYDDSSPVTHYYRASLGVGYHW